MNIMIEKYPELERAYTALFAEYAAFGEVNLNQFTDRIIPIIKKIIENKNAARKDFWNLSTNLMCPKCSEAYMYCACSDNPLNNK